MWSHASSVTDYTNDHTDKCVPDIKVSIRKEKGRVLGESATGWQEALPSSEQGSRVPELSPRPVD